MKRLSSLLPITIGSLLVAILVAVKLTTVSASVAGEEYRTFLPTILRPFVPPGTPALIPIDFSDYDNYYDVSWHPATNASTYILEEATKESFSDARVVYQGPSLTWSVPSTGKLPSSYYYRVKALGNGGESGWSNSVQAVVYPMFVGMSVRWDFNGYIRGSEYANVGSHQERSFTGMTGATTIRADNYHWYDPNPYGWPDSSWQSYYSITTGEFLSSSEPPDPSWKWGYGWRLSYGTEFANGQTVLVDDQPFTVTGPHSGYTTYGHLIQYWELVNKNTFLFWDGGGAWTQYVHAGEAVLRYDAGNSLLLLQSNVLRRVYQNGSPSGDTVQYIGNLTSSNSLPGSTASPIVEETLGLPSNASTANQNTIDERGPIGPIIMQR